MTASVTFTGNEVAHVVGALSYLLTKLHGDDFDLVDLMLERAIAGLTAPLAPEVQQRIDNMRRLPRDRFWENLCDRVACDLAFTSAEAAAVTGAPLEFAESYLRELAGATPDLTRLPIEGPEDVWLLPSKPKESNDD